MKFLTYLVLFFGSIAVLFGVAAVGAVMTLPDVGILEKCFTTTMYQVHLCPGGENYVKLNEISPYVLHAVIAAEDGSFYNHKGFDWYEIRQSMEANLTSGNYRRGGSTLTQQLAKNVFLDKEKSILRKIKEAYLAHGIEHRFDKNFILEKYLNVVEFGENIYGIKPAALHYFHKAPSALHPLEAAWLASLLPNPKKYSQSFRAGHLTPFSRKMVLTIVKRMESFGKLSPAGYQTAVASVDAFPWPGLSIASFGGAGSYSLDTDVPASAVKDAVKDPSPGMDENALEEMIEEDNKMTGDSDQKRKPKPAEDQPAVATPTPEPGTDTSPVEDYQ
jgi:monofunctional biosynthetic peptidoglycan transglycosylase